MPTRRTLLAATYAAGVIGATIGLSPALGHAEAYPDRPIRLIVPYAADVSGAIRGDGNGDEL